jgi:CDP-glucose 4,6-dehydratase
MSLNHRFWRGRRVFLTGHTGFKGSWLSLWLQMLGAETTGYALAPPTKPSLFEQAQVGETIRSIQGDIRDYDRLKSAIEESRPEVILHLAAQSVVRAGYDDPVGTYASNVMGTVHLLEAVRRLNHPCAIVNVTSDKCYENREWIWGYRENEAMGGHDPYSNSKGCAELVGSAYRDSFFPPDQIAKHGVALASARAGNAIGGGDWTSHQLIPDLMRAFLAGEPCLIRNPSAYRPWQFLLEPLRGYLMLAERLSEDGSRFASGWNFGPADADVKPVSWIADELVSLWGKGASWTLDSGAHPYEAHALKLDATRAAAGLEWRPVLPIKQALGWIAEWYAAFRDGAQLQQKTMEQIERYESLT